MVNLPKLLIDSGEPNTLILEIEKYPEFFPRFEVKELRVYDEEFDEWIRTCDFTNEYDSMAIERKVIHTHQRDNDGLFKDGDFHPSLMQQRLQDQLAKMNFYYERNKWLLTQGYLINYGIKHPDQRNYAYSMIGHCGTMNISFRECFDLEDFLINLYWINRESGSEPFKRLKVRSAGRKVISQLESLSDIPGVGIKRAIAIARVLPTLEEIIINREDLTDIDTIGKKTQEAICDWATAQIKIPE